MDRQEKRNLCQHIMSTGTFHGWDLRTEHDYDSLISAFVKEVSANIRGEGDPLLVRKPNGEVVALTFTKQVV